MRAENRDLRIFGHWFHKSYDPWNDAPPWAIELRCMLQRVLSNTTNLEYDMAQIDDEITQLTADVAAEQGAVDSAVAMLNGISQKIADAVAAALAAGATPAQLQAITDANTAIAAQTTALSSAVAANP